MLHCTCYHPLGEGTHPVSILYLVLGCLMLHISAKLQVLAELSVQWNDTWAVEECLEKHYKNRTIRTDVHSLSCGRSCRTDGHQFATCLLEEQLQIMACDCDNIKEKYIYQHIYTASTLAITRTISKNCISVNHLSHNLNDNNYGIYIKYAN
jgi:hypothetical protein